VGDGTRIVRVPELRCECGRSNCRETLPSVAETFRGTADRLLVSPTHVNGEVVVRAADRFFVVERAEHLIRGSGSMPR